MAAHCIAVLLALATALGCAAAQGQPSSLAARRQLGGAQHAPRGTPHAHHPHVGRTHGKTPNEHPHELDSLLKASFGSAGGGACVDEWTRDPTNKAYAEMSHHYGEDPVNNHARACDAADNAGCIPSRDHGCALWASVGQLCPARRTCAGGYVYLGDNTNDKNHVILVPTVPIRGIEDIVGAGSAKAIAATEKLWGTFWAESVARHTGPVDKTGFESPESGILVINPPFYREYHQMHIHQGKRLPALNACIQNVRPGTVGKWAHVYCNGLAGFSGQTDAELFWTTVKDLSDIWQVYLAGLAQPGVAKALSAAHISSIPQYGAYHVGMMVTSPTAFHKANEFLVILYAPSKRAAHNPDWGKLGRGQFITNNAP